ncbi:hypothetical protein HanXRQr2_Chr12g0530651 [Helianthus annuus]|uniref:Uncharacterized protein n=1 Tax=Helianthus annuus TaxID=4232 RepID=A0A251SZP8_HELAN|nr:hypothetical protein HanXRQr2_Chr12g0530651 [Helianthus annuus]KAJ0861853.1 hypothetical protein HanPSC8_Chr12g0511341 [Helianthus annuus]
MNKVWDTCPSIMQPFYVFGGKMWDVYVSRTGSELPCSCQLKINVRIQHRKLKDSLRSYRYAICNYLVSIFFEIYNYYVVYLVLSMKFVIIHRLCLFLCY